MIPRSVHRMGLALALPLAVLAYLVVAAPAGAYIYWSDYGSFNNAGGSTIARANQDASGLRAGLISGAHSPGPMAVDGQHIYWADTATNAIGRANLDGSGTNPAFITGAAAPTSQTGRSPQGVVLGLAVDAQHIYWTDDAGYIGRANLDGSGKSSMWIDTGQYTSPFGLAVHNTTIYVGLYHSIAAWPISGGTVHQTIASDSNWVFPPSGIAYLNGELYYTAGVGASGTPGVVGAVPASDISDSPTPHSNTFITGLDFPIGLTSDGTWLYWADNGSNTIGRARITSPVDRNDSFLSDSGGPFGIAVDTNIDPTATAVACTPASVTPGATTTCKATVTDSASSAVPTGLVNFSGNATTPFVGGASTSCTLTADPAGGASCVVGAIPQAAGQAPISAAYQGDAIHGASSGQASVCVGSATDCGSGGNTIPPPSNCLVPKLKGKTLKSARKLLTKAGCTLGKVKRPRKPHGRKLRTLIVAKQSPVAGVTKPRNTKVSLTLKQRPKPKPHAR